MKWAKDLFNDNYVKEIVCCNQYLLSNERVDIKVLVAQLTYIIDSLYKEAFELSPDINKIRDILETKEFG